MTQSFELLGWIIVVTVILGGLVMAVVWAIDTWGK